MCVARVCAISKAKHSADDRSRQQQQQQQADNAFQKNRAEASLKGERRGPDAPDRISIGGSLRLLNLGGLRKKDKM